MKNKFENHTKIILLITFMFSFLHAHVSLNQPSGGETFITGSTMDIQWHEDVPHGQANWDILFSADNGNSWQVVVSDLTHSASSYNWEIPDTAITNQGKIKVVQDNDAGSDYEANSGTFTITTITSLNEFKVYSRKGFTLSPAYPNPFNGSTTINFELPEFSHVEINIFNILGKKVAELIESPLNAGVHHIRWNPANLPSGVYFYTIKAGQIVKTQRLLYLK